MAVLALKLMGVLPPAAKARPASTATTACHFGPSAMLLPGMLFTFDYLASYVSLISAYISLSGTNSSNAKMVTAGCPPAGTVSKAVAVAGQLVELYAHLVDASRDIVDAARSIMPDAQVVGMEPMTGGSSAKVTALALFSPSPGQRRVVFRQHTPEGFKDHGTSVAAKEFGVLQQLHSRGLEVPKPLALHGPAPQHGPWLAMEWVEGTTARSDAQVEAAVEAMAHFLSRLHGLAGIHVPELTTLEDPAQVLEAHLPADQTGGAVAAALRRGINRRANSSVVLHGDYWPGNVMSDGGRLAAVVDWEDASRGDPLADVACARVEICCTYGRPAADRFTDAYVAHMRSAGNAVDLFDLPLWEIYVSATALGSMHLWGLAADAENARRRHTRSFLERAADEFLACR